MEPIETNGNPSPTSGVKEINDKIRQESSFVDLLQMEMRKVIVGQETMIERLLVG